MFKALCIASLVFALCNDAKTPAVPVVDAGPPLELSLTWADEEHSMDSNSTSESFHLVGTHLTYEWSYDGYHPDKNFKRQRKAEVTVKNVAAIRALIEAFESSKAGGLPDAGPAEEHANVLMGCLTQGSGDKTCYSAASNPRPLGPMETLEKLREALVAQLPVDRE